MIFEINTDQMQSPSVGSDLFENRKSVADMQQALANAEVSIIVQAYDNLEKTKRCIESILRYTANVDYELILIDNGSTDETLSYFESVAHDKKRVFRFTKNIGAGFPVTTMSLSQFVKFICVVPNDLIVTSCWMENMLACMKSDDRIGMVTPICSNTSNLQCVEFSYSDYEDMQTKAAQINRHDPTKWQDRLRLITLGTLYRKEALYASGWPLGDIGFFHDFIDDDITFAIRRAGYRTVLAGDTWVCHDHKLRQGEGKDPVEFQRSLQIGRENFKTKYYGIDAWDDVNNYLIPYLGYFSPVGVNGIAHVLGIDVRCGTPILDIKNHLKAFGVQKTELSAFTQDAKYWLDLKTICDGPVVCDREEFIAESFLEEYFDVVVVDRPLNRYHEPQKMINALFSLCKEGGYVFCKLKNAHSFQEYVNLLGQHDVFDSEFSYNITLEALHKALSSVGIVERIVPMPFDLSEDTKTTIQQLIPEGLSDEQNAEILQRMLAKEYLFIVKKK